MHTYSDQLEFVHKSEKMVLTFRQTSSIFKSTSHQFLHFSRFSRFSYSHKSLEPTDEPTKPTLPSLEPSKDAELLSQILIQHHNPFHAMESSLQLNGITLTNSLVHQILLRIRHFSKIALAFFTWSHNQQSHYQHDVSSYNLIIDIISKVRQFDVAWQLILQMDQNPNINADFTTFFVLMRRLISAGLTRQAIQAFDDLECFVEKSNTTTQWCHLLDTLCKYGYVKTATELFNQRIHKFPPNAKIYTIIIYGWCKINNIEMANRFFDEMAHKGIEPNVVTHNVLLNGICRRMSLHPDERFERIVQKAEKLFDDMRKRGIEPDVTSYSIVLHVYSRAHKPELLLDKLRLMKKKGVCPSMETYTSVIKCLCSCGRLDDATEFLNDMMDSGVSPSAAAYNYFFKEYRGRKDAESALRLYSKMKSSPFSCLPSIHTYNLLLGMFAKLNLMENVEKIWADMKASAVGPDLDSYTLLIHELCEKCKWKEACQLFVEMIEKGFLPQKDTFEILYRGLIQSDKLRTWRRLQKKLEEESITFGLEFERYHLKPYRR